MSQLCVSSDGYIVGTGGPNVLLDPSSMSLRCVFAQAHLRVRCSHMR